ncbi:hypothetical protein CQW23_27176 [Capsicum baccatum]|uniref:F-box domain-containing protein n=1 Tax=Capsicum baccatum TaxID=33114 RepID=A0A2G2VD25_CAPBA|nr:hypothetical protein CQW23_27176 [Capsicum baccatum]
MKWDEKLKSHVQIPRYPVDVDLVEAMEIHFQEEIIMDILTKLPVRSLLRFKCVSKFWKTLICDPYFKGKHLNYAKDDPDSQKFLICQIYPKERISSIYSCPLSPVQLPEDVQKLDCSLNARPFADCCCDGLVFLFASDGLNKQYMLWNPSTRESIVLPHPEFSLSCCMYGLAYDAASDDYKILKIDVTSVGPEVFNEILALKSGSWKRVGKPSFRVLPVSCGVPSGRDCLAFIHGTFHWVGLSNYGSTIVSFNISNEVYGQIPLLERMRIYLKSYLENEVSVLGGLLCFYSTANYQGEGTLNLSVMRDYGIKESWTNLYTIRDTDLYSARPKYRFADGEMLLIFRHLNRISLGPIFGTSKGQYFGLWPQCDTSREGFTYTESLISPKLLT